MAKRKGSMASGSTTSSAFCHHADLTIYVDIAPETAAKRKSHDRDRYERDLSLLARVRDSYLRQSAQPDWVGIDGEQAKEAIAEQMLHCGSRHDWGLSD